jgi:glycosyltransferase involved in cell wall biosynthesis
MKIIFVNATGLTFGGGLITLKYFLENIPNEKEYFYYIFSSIDSLKEEYQQNNIKFIFPKYKKGLGRIYWDMIGLKRWSNDHCIKPNLIISLQNTTILFDNTIPQISYIMQSIPFVDKQWNIFKKEERTLWFYKNIYPFFMSLNLNKNSYVITQSKWIKSKFANKFNFPIDKIFPIRPIIKINSKVNKKILNSDSFNIFCPTSHFVYKNNIEIVNALVYLNNKGIDISNFRVFFTFNQKDDRELFNKILNNKLVENFIFLDRLKHINMMEYYKGSDLVVFPSYLETFGLPLLEAAAFGKSILSSNEPYAIEVIEKYEGAKLLNINSPELWGEHILKEYKEKRSYKNFTADFQESWEDFFILIKKLINKES